MTSALRGEEGFLKADGCTERLCERDSHKGDGRGRHMRMALTLFLPGNMEEAGHVMAVHVGS